MASLQFYCSKIRSLRRSWRSVFEVSRRAINRDIEDICKAGIPLITHQGYGGGISIADGYKIDKSLFTEDELQTILAGLKGIDTVSRASNQVKLLDKFSSKAHRVSPKDTIIIDLASHYQIPLTQKIEAIKQAISRKISLDFSITIKGRAETQSRTYHLVFKWSAWYVFAYCLDRMDYRLFKLNRLWDLELTEESYLPARFPQRS